MPKIRSPKDYSVSGFNEYGDETQHWTLESPGTGNAQPINERLDEQFGKYFTSKIKTLQKDMLCICHSTHLCRKRLS